MADLTWPIDVRPSRWWLRIEAATAMFQSPYTGQVQVLERANQMWMLDATFEANDWDQYAQLQVLIGQLRGGARTVAMPVYDHWTPRGTWSGAPQVTAISGRSVTIAGFAASDPAAAKAGDVLRVTGGQIVQVMADVGSDGTGAALLSVEPLPRTAFASSFDAHAAERTIDMRVVPGSKINGELRKGPRGTFSLKFIEAF